MSKGKLLLLAILPVLAYFGAKAYLHYRVGEAVDSAIEQMAPFTEISYSGISSSWEGSVAVNGLIFSLPAFGEEIEVGAIALQTPGFFYLLDFKEKMSKGEFPDTLTLSVEDLEVRLHSEWMRTVEARAAAQAAAESIPVPCFESQVQQMNTYRPLGYGSLLVDFSMGYTLDRDDGQIALEFSQTVQDAYDVKGSLNLKAGSVPVSALMMGGYRPVLKSARLTLEDLSYTERLISYCVEKTGLSRDQAVDAQAEYFSQVLTKFGIVPDAPIMNEYKKFLDQPEILRVSAEPPRPVDLSRLDLYKAEDIPNLLNVNIHALER